jgi:hypothetical protein
MNDELKAKGFRFIVHRSSFRIQRYELARGSVDA